MADDLIKLVEKHPYIATAIIVLVVVVLVTLIAELHQ